jgi:hypothetical protein
LRSGAWRAHIRRARGGAWCRLGRSRRFVRRGPADPQPVAVAARLSALGSQLRAPRRGLDRPHAHRQHDRVAEHQCGNENARIAAAAPKVAAAIAGIKSRGPDARILVVNYAAILTEAGSGCRPQVPFAYSDVPYLRDKERRLNAMLASQAAAAGVRYVDDYTASIGRDAASPRAHAGSSRSCPANAAAPFHPNARGEAGIATVVAAASR